MKNYYEILQVNKNASREVIKNTYEILKHDNENSEDLKEAYNVLTDDFLREQYDKEYEKEYEVNYKKSRINSEEQNKDNQNIDSSKETKEKNGKKVKQKKSKVKTQKTRKMGSILALVDIIKNIYTDGKAKTENEKIGKWEKKDTIAMVSAIAIVIILGIILWFVPFTHEWMSNFLFNNAIGKIFVK